MRRLFMSAVMVTALLVLASTSALAASPNSQLRCFGDGALGQCSVDGNDAMLDTTSGGYAGVYVNAKRTNGKTLDGVDFSFSWSGTIGGGAPRFSLPIDEDEDGDTEAYAFLDANGCGGGTTGTVSTELATCTVFYGPVAYANWDAFAAANPTYTISDDIPFVIADAPADVALTDVTFTVS